MPKAQHQNELGPSKGRGAPLGGLERSSRRHVTALGPNLLLLLLEHAQGLPGVETELVPQDPRCGLPNSGFIPSGKERPSDMLNLLVRPIHLCPHTEALRSPVPETIPATAIGKVSDLRDCVCIKKDTAQRQYLLGSTFDGRAGQVNQLPTESIPLGQPCLFGTGA
jgi:hypothetical protein